MLKKQLRNTYRRKREEVPATEKMKWDVLLLIQFQTLDLPFVDHGNTGHWETLTGPVGKGTKAANTGW